MKDNKTTFEEHKIIGTIGKILQSRLLKNSVEIYNNARTKEEGKRFSKHWAKAEKHLNEFRNHMEEIMFIDFPKNATTNIYYGDRKEKNILDYLKKEGKYNE